MLYLAVAFTILQSVLVNIPMIWTSVIDDSGHCNDFSLWSNPADVETYSIFLTVWLYAVLLGVLIYCYGWIIKQLKRKTPKVAPAETNPANSGHEEGSMNRS